MSKKMISFPKIGQFRETIKAIEDRCKVYEKVDDVFVLKEVKPLPILTFKGTVKLHGTNAGITYNTKTKELYAQSRERIITPLSDNQGFAHFVESNKDIILELISTINTDAEYITIFGEWCGGNIQSGVALNQLNKMFVIFAVKLTDKTIYLSDDEFKHLKSNENRIYNILDFPTFEVDIDFANPSNVQNTIIEITEQVENECPVGKYFGVSGIGEGVVWKYRHSDGTINQFKVKGAKHSKSKVKKTQIVDVDKLNNINEFIDYVLTEERLNQGIERVFMDNELDIKQLGDYISWIIKDVISEELDTLISNNLEVKDVTKSLSNKARNWFLNKIQ